MKLGNSVKQSDDLHESIDKHVRAHTDRDLYWHIDKIIWSQCNTSIWFLYNATVYRYEIR